MCNPTVAKLVIVDDDKVLRNLVLHHAKMRGVAASEFEDGETAMKSLHDGVEVILLDLHMPGWNGIKCLDYLQEYHPTISTVILSGASEVEQAVQAMKQGAFDYLTKPFDPEELFASLYKAKKFHEIQKENQILTTFSEPQVSEVSGVVAEAKATKALVEMVKKVAPLDTSVLLTGESGVGKGLFARMIHSMSPRTDKPFITVSCPALPRELLESELFGHEKGAFTGAKTKRAGKIEAARGGTLFLDELGELPIDLQPKLLNVLQDGEYYPVGSEKAVKSDVRIIAATNINFEEKIAEGSFREDLYYRLNVFPLEIPPLRERLSELPALIEHILSKINSRYGKKGKKCGIKTIEALQKYQWPGNVRELENALERAWIMSGDENLEVDHFFELHSAGSGEEYSVPTGLGGIPLREIEKAAILQTLEQSGGNKAKAARLLGITEKTIYNKFTKYNIGA